MEGVNERRIMKYLFLKKNILCKENFLIIFLVLSIVFLFKGWLAIALIPLVFILKDKKITKEEKIILIGRIGFIKFILSFFITYSDMLNNSVRLMLLSIFLLYFFKIKKLKKNEKKIITIVIGIFFIGLIWSYFTSGGIDSFDSFKGTYKSVFILICLYYYLPTENIIKIISIGTLFQQLYIVLKLPNYTQQRLYSSITTSIIPMATSYMFYCFLKEKTKLRFIYLLMVGLGFQILSLTVSRGATLATLLTIILMVIFFYKKKSLKILLVMSIILSSFFIRSDNLKNKMSNLNDGSNKGRVELYKASFYTYKKNLLMGTGRENTIKYFNQYMDEVNNRYIKIKDKNTNEAKSLNLTKQYEERIRTFPDSHNVIIDFITENGILGYFYVFLLYIWIPYFTYKLYKKYNSIDYLLIGCVLISMNLAGLTWSLWTRHPIGIKYYFLYLSLILYRRKKDEIKCDSTSL